MSINSVAQKSMLAMAALAVCFGAFAQQGNKNVTLRPTQPTHYLFMPMARVNSPGDLVLGFHEISYALPHNLQIQASIIDNIGKVALGAKYGFARNMAFGGGLASTLVSFGGHGIHGGAPARLGLFFTYDIEESKNFGMAITPHTQIGDHISLGIDFGLRIRPVDFWSFLWEVGGSVDATTSTFYLYTVGALRIHPPKVPFLFFDIGVGTNEFDITGNNMRPIVFFDIMVCFKT